MKKLVLLLLPILMIVGLSAVDFDLSGEFRTRAAMYNDMAEDNGGHIDNRLMLKLSTQLASKLQLVYGVEVGDITWGAAGGGLGTDGVNIETDELYIEHQTNFLNTKVRLGQQYWADHRSLVLDDTFSGIMFMMDDLGGLRAEIAYMKPAERNPAINDDYHVAMASLYMDDLNAGLQAFYGNDLRAGGKANFTALPYIVLPAGPLELDATLFLDYQVNKGPADEEIGFGTALKATVGMDPLTIGGDLLYIGENGLTDLLPYYQNGLYLFGWGKWHDGVTVAFPYPDGNKGLMSAVGFVDFQLSPKTKLFGHAGYLTTFTDNNPGIGIEFNAGAEIDIIPDMVKLAPFGALGLPGDALPGTADMLYLLGTTVKVEF